MVHKIGRIAQEVDAWILVDEVYRGAELNRKECTSFWDIDYDKTIVNCGLSKAYGLPGLRIGWSISNPDYIQKSWATNDYTSLSVGRLSDVIASHVLHPDNRMKTLDHIRDSLTENLNIFQKWVDSHSDHFSFIPPAAGAMAFIGYDWEINSTELFEKVRKEASVLLVAGDWYGMDRYLRFGYGASRSHLMPALDRVTSIFQSL
jgi:hypothetical protein